MPQPFLYNLSIIFNSKRGGIMLKHNSKILLFCILSQNFIFSRINEKVAKTFDDARTETSFDESSYTPPTAPESGVSSFAQKTTYTSTSFSDGQTRKFSEYGRQDTEDKTKKNLLDPYTIRRTRQQLASLENASKIENQWTGNQKKATKAATMVNEGDGWTEPEILHQSYDEGSFTEAE